jgi:hypothetical protein
MDASTFFIYTHTRMDSDNFEIPTCHEDSNTNQMCISKIMSCGPYLNVDRYAKDTCERSIP